MVRPACSPRRSDSEQSRPQAGAKEARRVYVSGEVQEARQEAWRQLVRKTALAAGRSEKNVDVLYIAPVSLRRQMVALGGTAEEVLLRLGRIVGSG